MAEEFSPASSPALWHEFFDRYCRDAILELAESYPNTTTLIVDYIDVERWNIGLAAFLREHPDETLQHANTALREWDLPVEMEFVKAQVVPKNLPEITRRRDLRAEHVGKLVSIETIIQKISTVTPKILTGAFRCKRCDATILINMPDGKFVEPFECENEMCARKNCFEFKVAESEYVDYQKIRVGERLEDLGGGEKSQTIDCHIKNNDFIGTLVPGQRVTITGIVRGIQRTTQQMKTTILDLEIDVIHISMLDSQNSVVITDEDRTRLYELAKDPNIVSLLVSSFGSSVHGMELEKEALLLSSVSNGIKTKKDGSIFRDYSHVLICADPGTAKSTLKYALKGLKPDYVMASGTGATKAGLTAAAVKDDFVPGAWSIEAGALPLADRAGLVIDEFDKFDKDDVKGLNDALSNCSFEKDAAGLHVKLWARCNVVLMMNPKYGRLDIYEPPVKQLNLPADTLSRFDLLFINADIQDVKKDGFIADAMFDSRVDVIFESENNGLIPLSDLQKYIKLAYSLNPTFDPALKHRIKELYLNYRKLGDTDRVAVTPRMVEALLRLSKAEAQLQLSNIITTEHFERAASIINQSLKLTFTNEDGMLDADLLDGGSSQKTRIRLVRDIIIALQKEFGSATIETIKDRIGGTKVKSEHVDDIITKMKIIGDVIMFSDGRIKLVSGV